MSDGRLNVWMNGLHVGVWSTLRTGTPVFRYSRAGRTPTEGRALSLSLPFTASLEHRGDVVTNYFDNLLPESADIRRRLRSRFHASRPRPSTCWPRSGAIASARCSCCRPASSRRLERRRGRTAERGGGRADLARSRPTRHSGNASRRRSQVCRSPARRRRPLLLRMGRRWYRPRGATPTTHILKLPLGLVGNMRADMSDVDRKRMAVQPQPGRARLPVAETEMAQFGTTKVLVVTRFDRRWVGIEDGAEQRRASGRRSTRGSPGFRRKTSARHSVWRLIASTRATVDPRCRTAWRCWATASTAEEDRANFVLAQFAFWLLAATDGHAKNFSIQHRAAAAST